MPVAVRTLAVAAPVVVSSALTVWRVVRLGEIDTTSLRSSMACTEAAGSVTNKACTVKKRPLTVPPTFSTCARRDFMSTSPSLLTTSASTMRTPLRWLTQL